MSEYRPPNKSGKGKSKYHSVPMRTKSNVKSSGKGTGKQNTAKYSIPKKQKLPTPVIITNILMIGVILAVCGVVFAIAFNNIKYDKADASKNAERSAAAALTSSTQNTAPQSSKAAETSSAQSTVVSSELSSGISSAESSVEGSTSDVEPVGDYDADFFKDDLFIGDSIFTGLYGYSYIDRKNVAAAVGYTPYGAQETAFDESFFPGSAVEYAKNLQPKHIIIMLGSNGLSPQTDFDDFETGYRGLLNRLKTDCPESGICVISVPPITANSSMASYSGITNTIIDKANDVIKSLCDDLGVTYYAFNAVLKDENGYFKDEYAEVDGMHFLGSTYPVLLSKVQEVLEQQ